MNKEILFYFIISILIISAGIFVILYYKDKNKKFFKNNKQIFGMCLIIFGSIIMLISIKKLYNNSVIDRIAEDLDNEIDKMTKDIFTGKLTED